MLRKMLLPAFLVILLSGCAMTVNPKPLNHSYTATQELPSLQNPKPVAVAPFVDSRPVTRPDMIIHKVNLNGNTCSGGFSAEKPVAEIVRNAVIDGLKLRGIPVVEDADLVLSGDILSFAFDVKSGWVDVTVSAEMELKIQLVNKAADKILMRETYQGRVDDVEKDCVVNGFNQALDQTVTRMVLDPYLLQYIEP